MRKMALAGILFACTAYGLHAEPVKRSLVACLSEDLLDEASTYAVRGDKDGLMQLLLTGRCAILKVGDSEAVR